VNHSPWFWLAATLLCIVIQSFFSMQEMAIVSFNRIRLQYYVAEGHRRARWIDSLLKKPSRFYGTILLGINVAMQFGSQCSREFYTACNLDPDIAPLTQLFLVLIFAELAPLYAARRYAERVALFGIPLLTLLARLLIPLTWALSWISKIANRLVGGGKGDQVKMLLSREELQHIVEERHTPSDEKAESEEFNELVNNLFTFRGKIAKQAMTPLSAIRMLPSQATVAQMRRVAARFDVPCLPVYYQSRDNIVAIATPRDLLRIPDNRRVRDHASPPWFIAQEADLMQILKQFRYNHRSVAVVLDTSGQAVGLLTLDDILEEIFGESPTFHRRTLDRRGKKQRMIECTVPGNMEIAEFNRRYRVFLPSEEVETLAQLITKRLGHPPEEGEVVRVGPFELTPTETTLMGARTVVVRAIL
jgi:magnesium and cobalt exporter, CNNM family